MSNKTKKIKDFFIRKMISSSIIQIIILGILSFCIKDLLNRNQLNNIADDLLIKDEYTIDKIGSYQILKSIYALDLELHNLGDMRKLDSITYVPKLNNLQYYNCVMMIDTVNFKLCKSRNGEYLGASLISFNKKTLGYILTKKRYHHVLFVPIIYDLFIILLTIMAIFIINFAFLFLPIKRKIENNTKELIKSISLTNSVHYHNSNIDIDEYELIAQKFVDERNEIAKLQNEKSYLEARKNIAEQVAHDIRSPLAALNILTTQDMPSTEQSKILIRNAINRIRDIANDIIKTNRELHLGHAEINNTSTQLLAAIINSLITEKRLQFSSTLKVNIYLELSPDNYSLFIKINVSEFKRMLSNLIDNAVEALSSNGVVCLRIYNKDNFINLSISDNGSGIPSSVLAQLGQYRVTYNKPLGSGLGLFHAKKAMEQFGGRLEIISELNKGTDVILIFPHASIPEWFYPQLDIIRNSTLVIVDDDISIHHFWKERFKNFESNFSIIHFTDPKDFCEWHSNNQMKSMSFLYLLDLEFSGCDITGIKIIEECNIQQNTVLVTSHFENIDLHAKCEKLGVKIIPKDLAVYVPIKLVEVTPMIPSCAIDNL